MTFRYQTLATAEEVDARIEKIAKQILTDFPAKSPLFVTLMSGANPFASKLMFAIAKLQPEYHPDINYMTVSTYGGSQQAGEPHLVLDLSPKTIVRNRDVIVLDDVLDKGVTAHFVFNHLHNREARSVKLGVLCTKEVKRAYPIEAEYCGFTFGQNWLVGMGMDHAEASNEAYRWLDEIRELIR